MKSQLSIRLLIVGALSVLPALLPATAARAELPQGVEIMAELLPDVPKGWTADKVEGAKGALPLYTGMHAQRTFRKGPLAVTVAMARAKPIVDAVRGSITTPALLPPGGRVEMVNGFRVLASETSKGEKSIRYPFSPSELIVVSTTTGSYADLAAFVGTANLKPRFGR